MRNFLLAALLALIAAPLAYAQSAGYRIQPGDQLAITVLEDETLNRTTLVLPDGSISVPLAGTVNAAGRSVDAVESAIADRLASNFAVRPSVFVSVTSVSETGLTFPIYVVGQVGEPGQREVEAGTTLLQAIALAGGLDRFAATKRIQLRRSDPSTGQERLYIFNYNAVERDRLEQRRAGLDLAGARLADLADDEDREGLARIADRGHRDEDARADGEVRGEAVGDGALDRVDRAAGGLDRAGEGHRDAAVGQDQRVAVQRLVLEHGDRELVPRLDAVAGALRVREWRGEQRHQGREQEIPHRTASYRRFCGYKPRGPPRGKAKSPARARLCRTGVVILQQPAPLGRPPSRLASPLRTARWTRGSHFPRGRGTQPAGPGRRACSGYG